MYYDEEHPDQHIRETYFPNSVRGINHIFSKAK